MAEPNYEPRTPFYSPRSFADEKRADFTSVYGNGRRAERKYNRYMKSNQRHEDQLAFDKAENDKMLASADARFKEINDAWLASQVKPEVAPAPETQPTPAPAPQPQPRPLLTPRSDAYWNQQAQKYGFADMNAVAEWQRQNKLEDDGKFGLNSLDKWNELQAARQAQALTQQKSIGRDIADDMPLLGSFVTGRDFVRDPSKKTAVAFGKRLLWDTVGAPAAAGRVVKGLWDGAKGWWNSLPENKQGGSLVKMHQQGGQMQNQQELIVALVQAAMLGDQKATLTVNQIMEAAKAGDQKAIQYAQMIQQVVEAMKQLQGQQTPVKRYGSKLNYIKSLKYAKGGKTCPACEQKVEMKKCGGKKAKKRYFGGYL